MPNKIAPSLEEAKFLIEQNPNRMLKEWAKEWGVSIERVRQIKEECGFHSFKNVNNELVDVIINRIKYEGYTMTNRDMYKDLPIGYDRFRTWCLQNKEIQEKVNLARDYYLSSEKSEKKCYKCLETKNISEYEKSQKYKDGYNRYCKVCIDEIGNTHEEVKTKVCLLCQNTLSVGSFNANRNIADGYSSFCKNCQSKQRRKKRLIQSKIDNP